jgi:hypothetical protein
MGSEDSKQRDRPHDEAPNENEPAVDSVEPAAGDPLPEEPQPLVTVRYGLGKEVRLYPDAFAFLMKEQAEELRVSLDTIRRLLLSPGEHTPSKLVLMLDLDDGTTIIAAEGMTNVRDFRRLLAKLAEIRPQIELDPPDMSAQLGQALEIRTRSLVGCYGTVLGACLLLTVVVLAFAWLGHHAAH